MTLMPRRTAGQLALLLVAVLLVAQAMTIWILADERQGALRSASLEHVIQRVADAYTLLDTTPEERRPQVLRALSSPTLRLSVDPEPLLEHSRDVFTRRQLARSAGLETDHVRTRLEREGHDCSTFREEEHEEDHGEAGRHDDDHDEDDEHEEDEYHRDANCPPVISASLALSSGQWFNASAQSPAPSWLWLKATLTSVGITALLLVVTLVLAIRHLLRPVNELSRAAHAFGRGEKVTLEERGPEDIREVTRAFNQMQHQVSRAQEDRERLLAALAHDLRTPITSMRLRVEMLPEGEDRTRLLETLQDMQHLAEATLDFIRGSTTEQHRRYDLSTLLDSLCDDLKETGLAVSFTDSPRCVLQGQPEAVKRAIRNLIENAVNYGDEASVSLATTGSDAVISIVDRGPGIPRNEREQVFQPFYRLEHSRNRDTGGAGLGLAIARTLIRGMGGDIQLDSGPEGIGLEVVVTLPREREPDQPK